MRLSGGELRSRRIHVPSGQAMRPTPGRVREALFSILGERVRDARVLDLYAGSGAIGFEALSRGAAHVTFVEAHRIAALRIRALADELGVAERSLVVTAPVERATRVVVGPFDIVYADPPFALPPPAEAFATLRERGAVSDASTIVYEHRARGPANVAGMRSMRTARYGEVALEFLAYDA